LDGFITDSSPTVTCIVGSSYKIAPIENLKYQNGKGDLRFHIENAPPGFFIDNGSGEMLFAPTRPSPADEPELATLYAVDKSGGRAIVETLTITVEFPSKFVFVPTTIRKRSGKTFTDPTARKMPYYVGESYRIASLELDLEQTKPSAGGRITDITYTLVGAPDGWFVSALTGEITGTFEEAGVYTMSTHAVDAGGQTVEVESLTFNVQERAQFRVVNYVRAPSAAKQLSASEYVDPITHTTPYAVGDTYRFASIILEKVENTDDSLADISFTIEGAPPGFLIDPADGYIQGSPLMVGSHTVSLVAVDSQNYKTVVETFTVNVQMKDTDSPSFGPNGAGCAFGQPVDADRFDQMFTCDCTSTSYTGSNCNIEADLVAADTAGKVAGGLVTTFILLLGFGYVGYKIRIRQISLRVFDFELHLQQLTQSGVIDLEQGAKGGTPREIKRSHVIMTDKVGAGQFGEVWKGLLDESATGGVPGYMVAIKTTHETHGEAVDELTREALVMAQVTGHRHVVALIGVVTSGPPLLLLLSLCEHGSLQSCLKEGGCPGQAGPGAAPSENVAHNMALEIASGMAHLAKCHFVHRDLAARNVLLDIQFVCKIADFGLSRGISASDTEAGDDCEYYRSQHGAFPVRWTAPEAIENMKVRPSHFLSSTTSSSCT
jgi:hypothetical protein